ISLAYSLPILIDAYCLDAFDAVRRASLETFYLACEFRLKESTPKLGKWLEGIPDTWSPDFKLIERVVLNPGPAIFGKEYGDFSELAHPTFTATQNSGACLALFSGTHPAP